MSSSRLYHQAVRRRPSILQWSLWAQIGTGISKKTPELAGSPVVARCFHRWSCIHNNYIIFAVVCPDSFTPATCALCEPALVWVNCSAGRRYFCGKGNNTLCLVEVKGLFWEGNRAEMQWDLAFIIVLQDTVTLDELGIELWTFLIVDSLSWKRLQLLFKASIALGKNFSTFCFVLWNNSNTQDRDSGAQNRYQI